MTPILHSWWQKIKQHPVRSAVVLVAGMLGIALLVVLLLGYLLNWGWTGLGPYLPPVKDSNFQRGKTLWDWLQLLIIPAVLAIAGYAINFTVSRNEQKSTQQRDQTEREIAADNQREEALQSFIDKMSELLLEKHLRESKEQDEVRTIARVRTLTVLPYLDEQRKRSILQFLQESGLIEKSVPIIVLRGADLRGADLGETDLRGTYLRGARMRRAYLGEADLRGADLRGTDLRDTDLREADLREADLGETRMRGAYLGEADLRGADLRGAEVTIEQLHQAKLLQSAIMPDGTKHP